MTTKKKPTKEREQPEDFNQAAFRAVQHATMDKGGGIAQKRPASGVTRKPDRRGILLKKPKR
jgi:hypothetical protein